MGKQFIVSPPISGDTHVGTEGDGTELYLGRLAETGPLRKVHFRGSKEFVILLNGKRGSGKSHTLGVLMEGLAAREDETSFCHHKQRRAALLLDPMGNFWTTVHLARPDGPAKVRQQHASLDGWQCQPAPLNVKVWIPAGFKTTFHPPEVQEFFVRVPELDSADLADLLGVNLVRDPQGAALLDAYQAVVEDGYTGSDGAVAAKADFAIADLCAYVEYLRGLPNGTCDHAAATLRALLRSLRVLERQAVFSGAGTPLTGLLSPGQLSVLMLPVSVGPDLRRVITRLLIRRILKEREEASQMLQRIAIEDMEAGARETLQAEIDSRIPRTVLALDEAQELLGDEGGEARRALENFCLLGRNYGLSLVLATQRPTASAISTRVRSQVDLCLIHRLLTQEDVESASKNLLGLYPEEVRYGSEDLTFAQLVRSLEPGQAVVSASHAQADGSFLSRVFVMQVRPRISVHGGETP